MTGVRRVLFRSFDGVGGVLTLETRAAFVETLRRLTEDHVFHVELSERQKQCQAYWGRLDGGAGERLIRLFERLAPAA